MEEATSDLYPCEGTSLPTFVANLYVHLDHMVYCKKHD